MERGATPLGRNVSDDLISKVERGYPTGGNELWATYRGSKEAMLPIGRAYRQADKKSEDTRLRITSSRLPIGEARKLCYPSGEHRGKPPLNYSLGEDRGKPLRMIPTRRGSIEVSRQKGFSLLYDKIDILASVFALRL